MALDMNPQSVRHDQQVAPSPFPSGPVSEYPSGSPLGTVLWRSRRLFAVVAVVMFALGCVLLQILPATYTSSMTLAPPDANNNNSILYGAQDLAANLGFTIPSAANDEQDVAIEQMTSYAVASKLAETRQDLIQGMFRSRWSGTEWIIPDDTMAIVQDWVSRLITGRPFLSTAEPSPYEIMNALIKRVDIKRNRDNSIVKVSFDDTDADFAREFLDATFTISQSIIRDRRTAESNSRMRYVRAALDRVTVVEYRDTLIKLMSVEEQSLMMIAAGSDIGIRMIDRPYVATSPSGPKPFVVLVGSELLGLLLAVTLVAIRARRKTVRR